MCDIVSIKRGFMTTYFIIVSISSVLFTIIHEIYKSTRPIESYEQSVQRLFINTPEQTEKIIRSANRRESLISNGAVVLIVLLSYWLCLYFQVF